MSLRIVVLAKQVPDTANITGEAMKPDGTVNRGALPAIFNPEDLNALEMALCLRDQHGGHITVVSMGPPGAAELLRDALYRGADRVILLTHRLFAGADTLATSYALARAVATLGTPDIVLCGRQAIDGDTAQVGPQIAEKLGIPQVTYVDRVVELGEGTIVVSRTTDRGTRIVRSTLPVLLTIVSTANRPRPPSVRRIMTYKKARTQTELMASTEDYLETSALGDKGLLIEEWGVDMIGAEPNRCGMAGSPTWVKRVASVVISPREVKRVEPTQAGISALVEELITEHVLS
ncbi:MAG: electron transfer flavoprotein subunit beta/FixA family protein [Candidatus Eisenbacteria bacterium]|jgi:electron transfer flavoprotein beta subunit|nr:electron transfer flavoprotein subunit beta/FixA family protein [Candidatus Eisenbacteria bacterium]